MDQLSHEGMIRHGVRGSDPPHAFLVNALGQVESGLPESDETNVQFCFAPFPEQGSSAFSMRYSTVFIYSVYGAAVFIYESRVLTAHISSRWPG